MPRRVREKSPDARGGPPKDQGKSGGVRPRSLLLDTNVVLDVILARAPWDAEAVLLLEAIARGGVVGSVAAHAVTTIYYIVERSKGRTLAATAVSDLLQVVDVVPLDAADFQRALSLGLTDYEDAVQVAACLRAGADLLVTRNPRDFKGAPVTTRSAGEVMALLAGPTSK
jgi:predicted nucleic acid-binding protein